MVSNATNLGTLTPIHTDFGSNPDDLLVVEYDVPQTKVKQTLFYKYGQLSIPKWVLIPLSILAFGILTALCAIILNTILSQSTTTVTYSQTCSKTSNCQKSVGLSCGTQSRCICSTEQYWYEKECVNKPTYTEQCNQTTECRTDLGLICADVDGQCNCPKTTKVQTCDCPSTSYWTGSTCTGRAGYLGACGMSDTSYQCQSSLYCDGSKCICSPQTQYWNYTADQCYSIDTYRALCDLSTSYSCDASVSLYCLPDGDGSQCPFNATVNVRSCDCANGTYWNGGSCASKKSYNTPCFWNCECDSSLGLQCLNTSCVCPKKFHWSTSTSNCESQKNYTQGSCSNTSQCDTSQGLTCYLPGMTACNCPMTSTVNTCDCSATQYYDYNLTSCQTLQLYNETCYGDYMCNSSAGLFCQLALGSTSNCSCPEPARLNMCDCNTSSYWDGTTCAPRLSPNTSCSYNYECQTPYICIVNATDLGIFSDVCRCPLGSYFVNGSGCQPSRNYTQTCEGSYQCYELAPLSCRYNDTGLTCLDSDATPLPACDCSDDYYFNIYNNTCLPLVARLGACTANCQCALPYQCVPNKCDCINYFSSTQQTCIDSLSYGDICSNTTQCNASGITFMSCLSNKCACAPSGYWNGSQCIFTSSFRVVCTNDNNCGIGLECQKISCIDSNKRCSCPDDSYYIPSSQTCAPCNGTFSNYSRYVINYPTSDICIAVFWPSGSTYKSFSDSQSWCATLAAMPNASSPRLLSVHNQTELNCIANVLDNARNNKECNDKRYYYVGSTAQNNTLFDGTSLSSAFPAVNPSSTQCLAYCYQSADTGSVSATTCNGVSGPPPTTFGALCDYRVYQ